jgi:hypothetical protein
VPLPHPDRPFLVKLFDARDRATIQVVTKDGAILQKVPESQEHMLREVGFLDHVIRRKVRAHLEG